MPIILVINDVSIEEFSYIKDQNFKRFKSKIKGNKIRSVIKIILVFAIFSSGVYYFSDTSNLLNFNTFTQKQMTTISSLFNSASTIFNNTSTSGI